MLKLTGCILIFISCCLLGFMKASAYKARSRELESILELIKILEMEIFYRKEPLAKTFRKAAALKSCWFSRVLQSCSEALTQQRPLHEAWRTAIEKQKSESPLDAQDIDVLRDMALGLGKSDIEGQNRILEPATLRIAERLQKAKQQEEKQGRMYKGLGISAGVVIVILII